ncbi:MAG TPA: hypothetical protein VK711_12825 [Puia sp.]|jgi:hypothetical protein|nr:hypothetical protein [Puia sp.]
MKTENTSAKRSTGFMKLKLLIVAVILSAGFSSCVVAAHPYGSHWVPGHYAPGYYHEHWVPGHWS